MAVDVETEFFPEYGVHTVEIADKTSVHIFSQPDWDSLHAALATKLPESGVVLTSELSVFPRPQEEIEEHHEEIFERLELVRAMSRLTEATILLGMPMREKSGHWFNSVLHVRSGIETEVDQKIHLNDHEFKLGFMTPANPATRTVRAGRGVLICSELRTPKGLPIFEPGSKPETALVPACWSVPGSYISEEMRSSMIERHGDEAKYWRNSLTISARIAFRDIPSLNEIVVADRLPSGSNGQEPLNAIFRRQRG
jgi:hypothetical protein